MKTAEGRLCRDVGRITLPPGETDTADFAFYMFLFDKLVGRRISNQLAI